MNVALTHEQMDELQDACDALDISLRHGYHGRDMYGEHCIGIIGKASEQVRLASYLEAAGSGLFDLFPWQATRFDNLGLNTIAYWPTVSYTSTTEYTVSVSNKFTAETPEDALRQMVAWLDDNAAKAGYRIDDGGGSVFLDAETVL